MLLVSLQVSSRALISYSYFVASLLATIVPIRALTVFTSEVDLVKPKIRVRERVGSFRGVAGGEEVEWGGMV